MEVEYNIQQAQPGKWNAKVIKDYIYFIVCYTGFTSNRRKTIGHNSENYSIHDYMFVFQGFSRLKFEIIDKMSRSLDNLIKSACYEETPK